VQKTRSITVTLDKMLVERIDEKRGLIKRSSFIAHELEKSFTDSR